MDELEDKNNVIESDEKYMANLQKQIKKIRDWVNDNDDKPGAGGKPIKSNITDNDSAKMKTSKGFVQGYNGFAMVDSKHQVVVGAGERGRRPTKGKSQQQCNLSAAIRESK